MSHAAPHPTAPQKSGHVRVYGPASGSTSSALSVRPRAQLPPSIAVKKQKEIEKCRFGGKCTKDDCTRDHGTFGSEADRQLFEVMQTIGIVATIEQTIILRRKQVQHAKKISDRRAEKISRQTEQSSQSSDDDSQ